MWWLHHYSESEALIAIAQYNEIVAALEWILYI